MDMKTNMTDIFKILSNDETLLRLLHYRPQNASDSPLDPAKPNILDLSTLEKWTIINDVIKTTYKTDDLVTVPKCRLLFYPGRRPSASDSYLFARQKIIFDILVHFDFESMDLRMEWIADRLNDLIFNKRITGLGKTVYEIGDQITAPQNYVGYRLVYWFSSENY